MGKTGLRMTPAFYRADDGQSAGTFPDSNDRADFLD
jgi:hypothetical protein